MRNSLLLCCSFLFCLLLLPFVRSALPNAVRTQFVKSTNAIRSNLALGKLANRNGTKLPAGRNVYQLLYSTQLEAEAQKWVDTCAYKYPNVANVAGNAIKLAGIKPINATTAITVVNAWLNPLKTQGLQSLVLTARDDKSVRGFVRMAWATSREIGCAMKQCPSISGTLAVCLYSKATVQVGKMIYGRGAACKKNADCTSYAGSTCTVATGLCYSKPPVPATTTSKAATTTPKATTTTSTSSTSSSTRISTSTLKPTTTSTQQTTTPSTSSTSTTTTPKPTTSSSTSTTSKPTSTSSTSSSTLKPTTTSTRLTSTTTRTTTTTTAPPNPDLTDAQRMLSLNAHNSNRSTVAKGNAINKNGTTIPPAKDMLKMTWSKMCESYAKKAVAPCVREHTNQNNTGQNLFYSTGYQAVEYALDRAVRLWYDELVKDGQNSLLMDGTNYNHFSQVVWAKSHEIGCAVGYCPSLSGFSTGPSTFVACQYSPPGNYNNQNIYVAGPTCSACPTGSTCETSSGLCKKTGVPDIHN